MIRSYERWAGEYNISLDRMPALLGMSSASVSAALLPHEDVESATERIEVLEVTDTEGVVALPGAIAALELLPDDRVAIATSCTQDLMHENCSAAATESPIASPDPSAFLR